MRPLEQVLADYPHLTLDGFDNPERPGFADDRRRIAAAVDQFDRAVAWLRMVPWRKAANRTHGHSYYVKHIVQGAMGDYVANGALIAAALALGVVTEPCGKLNALLGISSPGRWPVEAHPKNSRIFMGSWGDGASGT